MKKEKKINKKEEELKNQSGDNAYVRPRAKGIPKKKKKKDTISSTGRNTNVEDEEMIEELPSRSTQPLIDRLEDMKKDKKEKVHFDEDDDFEITL
jgi:hypothetical protein